MTTAVIELCAAAVYVTGDPLNGFKSAVIFQKIPMPVAPKEGSRQPASDRTSGLKRSLTREFLSGYGDLTSPDQLASFGAGRN